MFIQETEILAPKPAPCVGCPYRQDVPSGVWSADMYDLLPAYDDEIADQPQSAFLCHEQTGHLCAGWVGCHGPENLIALMLLATHRSFTPDAFRDTMDYVPHPKVLLWLSGTQAAEHGKRDIEHPSEEARTLAFKLMKKPAPLEERKWA